MHSRAETLALALASKYGTTAQNVLRDLLVQLTPTELSGIGADWSFWARPKQLAPTLPWNVWLIMAGRAFGKTRAANEYILGEIIGGRSKLIAYAGRSMDEVEGIMVEGKSGILRICPPWVRCVFFRSKRRIDFPDFGARIRLLTAQEPEAFRGHEHDLAWCDEVGSWPKDYAQEAMGNLVMSLRIGDNPRRVITTTPRKGSQILYDLRNRAAKDPLIQIVHGDTRENRSNVEIAEIIEQFGGTALGLQEIEGQLLEDVGGALFKPEWIRYVDEPPLRSELVRVMVGVDPAATSNKMSDLTGIVVVGVDSEGTAYVLEDQSGRLSPEQWARRSVSAYERWQANAIVVEKNSGGDMCKATIRGVSTTCIIEEVRATVGKQTRAEPVAALYEQGRVIHVARKMPELEHEMTTWDPANAGAWSPNRVDALVWAMKRLVVDRPRSTGTSLPQKFTFNRTTF